MRVVANANMRHFFIFFRSWLPPLLRGGGASHSVDIFSCVPKMPTVVMKSFRIWFFVCPSRGQRNSINSFASESEVLEFLIIDFWDVNFIYWYLVSHVTNLDKNLKIKQSRQKN